MRLKIDADAEAAVTAEHVLFARVQACYAAWSDAAGGAAPSAFAADDALVRDGDALLGSLIFSDSPAHARLAPPEVDV